MRRLGTALGERVSATARSRGGGLCRAPLLQQRAGFAIYRTPNLKSKDQWIVERQVKVAAWMKTMRPAFETLREDKQKELDAKEFAQLCPRLKPEIVDMLFSIFDTYPRDGKISYDEFCAYVILASDWGTAQDKIEHLFPLCDVNGDNMITVDAFVSTAKMLYYARYKDQEFVTFKVAGLTDELATIAEDCHVSFRHFAEWAQSDSTHISELRRLLETPLMKVPGDEEHPETWTVQAKADFKKVKVEQPIVELDGDEMTRIIWHLIKVKLIFPFLDMDIDYYDLSITFRDETEDQVTRDAAAAIQKHNVGIKCATITADAERVLEFNLKEMWKSPNGTIRNILDGTVFRAPIIIKNIPRYVPSWSKPIVVGRHAHGDQYKSSALLCNAPGTFKLVFEPADGSSPEEVSAYTFTSRTKGGVMLGMYNTRASVEKFAKSCFEYALDLGLPLYFSSKSSILIEYDGMFVEVFDKMYKNTYKQAFAEKGISYTHALIDEMVGQAMKSSGGFVWACKNSDGDLLGTLTGQGYGSMGLMTSVLVCPDGKTVLTESAHGTVTDHYRAHQRGDTTSTNPVASIFAWSRGLAHRAKLDSNERLAHFAAAMEEACISCVEDGQMTEDLAICVHGEDGASDKWLSTEEILDAISSRLRLLLANEPFTPSRSQDTPSEDNPS